MPNYYDIDDILIEEQHVPVAFHKLVNGVKIDSGAEKDCVEQGAKVELPFWLAQELHLRQAVLISLPGCYNQKTGLEIQADAACVDLRSRCQYFYEFGCKIAPLYKEILTMAHTAAYAAASKYFAFLMKEESNIYEAAQWSMAAFKKWRMGSPRLQRATILGRKRKPT